MNRSEEDIPLILKDWLIERGCWDKFVVNYKNPSTMIDLPMWWDTDDMIISYLDSFTWRKTPEKHDFWRSVLEDFYKYYHLL